MDELNGESYPNFITAELEPKSEPCDLDFSCNVDTRPSLCLCNLIFLTLGIIEHNVFGGLGCGI